MISCVSFNNMISKILLFAFLFFANIFVKGQHLDSAKKWIQQEWTLKETLNIFGSFGLNNGDTKRQKVDSTWTWKFLFSEEKLKMYLINNYGPNDTLTYWYKIDGDSSYMKLSIWNMKDKKKKDKQIFRELRINRIRSHELVLDYEKKDPFWGYYLGGNLFYFKNEHSDSLIVKEKVLTGSWYTLDSIYLGIHSFNLTRAYQGFQRGNDVISFIIYMSYKNYESSNLGGQINESHDSHLDSSGRMVPNSKYFQHGGISYLKFNSVFSQLKWELIESNHIIFKDDSSACNYHYKLMPDSSIYFTRVNCFEHHKR